MAKKKMIRLLIIPFTLIITLSLLALTWFSFSTLKSFYIEETQKSLLSKSYILQSQVIPLLVDDQLDSLSLQKRCTEIGKVSETRITVMLPNGIVIADSEENPSKMDNHSSRAEMQNALSGLTGNSIRYSNTLQRSMMYLAIRLEHEGEVVGVLRLSVTIESINKTINALSVKILFALFIVAILAALTAYFISKRISQPLEELKVGAERFAKGDFENHLPISDSEEIAQLAIAMNIMATELDERIKIITRQRNEQKVILQSMVESVIAIDKSENILNMNKAAGELFGVDPEDAQGKSVYEIIRNAELQEIVIKTLKENKPHEGEITQSLQKEKFISYNSSILKGASGSVIGILLVLNDITRLRFLENIRQDFVANVSHELRTPITSIKGFVETLIDSGTDNKEDVEKFLGIISKQANRLTSIIEDLVSLSRIEQGSDVEDINFERANIFSVIQSSIQICEHKANKRNITIQLSGDESIEADTNIPLFEQAVINLLDNAINYSSQDSTVFVHLEKESNRFKVIVTDEGVGIESRHHDRLFERFYRADKARSRELGGTGLGLAIVKHISLLHKGAVSVESELGIGSTFTIEIPL